MNYEVICSTVPIKGFTDFYKLSSAVQKEINPILKKHTKDGWKLHSISQAYIPDIQAVNVIITLESN